MNYLGITVSILFAVVVVLLFVCLCYRKELKNEKESYHKLLKHLEKTEVKSLGRIKALDLLYGPALAGDLVNEMGNSFEELVDGASSKHPFHQGKLLLPFYMALKVLHEDDSKLFMREAFNFKAGVVEVVCEDMVEASRGFIKGVLHWEGLHKRIEITAPYYNFKLHRVETP